MPDAQPSPTPDQSVLARAVGVIFSPSSTFRAVVANPRPTGILFLVCVVLALAQGLPQFTERGRQALLDMQLQQVRNFGAEVTPDMQAAMERRAPYTPYITIGSIFLAVPFFAILFTAIYWAIFNTVLGGTASFKQVLAIVTHSQVIAAIGAVLTAPIQYLQGTQTMAGPFNLGALAPMLEPQSLLARILAALSVIVMWQIVVTAIGLGVLYRRKSTGIAVALILLYIVLVAGGTAAFSSFTRQ